MHLLKQANGAGRVAQCGWWGFDMDHTLVKYKTSNLLPLIYKVVGDFVRTEFGYPADLFDAVPFDPDFCSRGANNHRACCLL